MSKYHFLEARDCLQMLHSVVCQAHKGKIKNKLFVVNSSYSEILAMSGPSLKGRVLMGFELIIEKGKPDTNQLEQSARGL